MTFFFDHDVPEDTAFALEAMGHRVVRVRQVLPMDAKDDEVHGLANLASEEQYILPERVLTN